MKTSPRRMDTARPLAARLAVALLATGFLSHFPEATAESPRPPLPPVPAFGLLHTESFDEPYGLPSVVPVDRSVWIESWSGWALQRQGDLVSPWAVPMIATNGVRVDPQSGAVRFWYRPEFASGSGSGKLARLLTLATGSGNNELVWWSLIVTPDARSVELVCETEKGTLPCLTAAVDWTAGGWNLLTLGYSPTNCVLFLGDTPVGWGEGVVSVPEALQASTRLIVGSGAAGAEPAAGQIEELSTFSRSKRFMRLRGLEFGLSAQWDVVDYYSWMQVYAALGPVSAEEMAAVAEQRAKRKAELAASGKASGGGVAEMRLIVGGTSECFTNVPLHITNAISLLVTNQGWTVQFDVQGTNAPADIFTVTNLLGSHITNAVWTWLERGPSCSTYQYTNQPNATAFYVLGGPQDSDGDGLTDAYEALVSKSDPTVGENRIQSENAITGTTDWLLSNPVTVSDRHGWPTNDADTTPEIAGFASATSVNVAGFLDLYVDVRNGDPNFTFEIFRLGWYGGLGGRKMTWEENGVPVHTVTLASHKQPVPYVNPTNGLIDCLSGAATNGLTNTNLIWQHSYTLTVPPDWVSGVYLAKLTTGTNVTPQTTGKQSYVIFTVREDARSSDLLVQASVTSWQAYNPWGGSSIYPYPYELTCNGSAVPGVTNRTGTAVSFNRPYAAATCNYLLAYGSGAGEFLTAINQVAHPGWEYNLVRWLERQGYDLTYDTSIDTHRPWPANKSIKAFLSLGHDEYWSGMMRTNTEAARDQGVNLGFFGANVCFYQIHFDPATPGERVFSVNKIGETDLWRGAVINQPEISMVGVQFAGFPAPVAPIALVGGPHWAYDFAGVTNGQLLNGLLGYEVDGCVEGAWCIQVGGPNQLCPGPATIRLADSIFADCGSGTNIGIGHSYVTLYTNTSGAQVFAAGTLQWSWGLDGFGFGTNYPWSAGAPSPYGPSRVHPAAQQMTHNVLRKFAGRGTVPVIFVNADAVTSGNWTNRFGAEGYWIAGATLLTNLPAYAQVTLSNQTVQVWADPSTDPKALLKPGSSNRIAAAWTTTNTQNSSFTIDVNLTDTNEHQIALYCADWLGTGSILQKIEVFESTNTAFSSPLDTRDFNVPPNGVYWVWKFSGHKIIRITKKDSIPGNKAMISGLFFGGG